MASPGTPALAAALLLMAHGAVGDAVCAATGSAEASAAEPWQAALLQQVTVRSPGQSTDVAEAREQRGLQALALAGPAPAPPPVELLGMASAPQPHLVKKAVAKAKKLQAAAESGDLHYTQHGCHCLLDWTFEGRPQKGCSKETPDFANGHHWCQTMSEDCTKNQGVTPSGEKWDYCFLEGEITHSQTVHGCHCAPHWDWNNTDYEFCSRTSQGPMWCYVFESGSMCPDSLRTEHHGQHWDYCFVEEQTSPYLTKAGCHCMPDWKWEGSIYEGCSKIGEKTFCQVLEDATACPMGQPSEGTNFHMDECSVVGGEEDALVPTMETAGKSSCHCQPRWSHSGTEYEGCAKTPDGERRWCYILEDARMCEEADGMGGGKEVGQRWRYCADDQPAEQSAQPQPAQQIAQPQPAKQSAQPTGAVTHYHVHYHTHEDVGGGSGR